MTLLSPNHNYAADECIAQIPQHHIPTAEEKVRASESFNKGVLVAAHMAALHDAYIMEMATHPVNEVTIKPSSPTSSIGGLKPSTLKQLKVGKVHRRRVLNGTLCVKTLCTKSHNGLMVVNVFEDEEGNATPIYLSNAMEGNGGSAQAQRLYPQDSKVAVKEPYLTRLPDGEIVLLVEKTTDLVFLWVPDYVEEKGTANEGSKDSNGLYENGRDAFAMEKAEDASVNDGVHNESEGKDGGIEALDINKDNGDLCEDGVIEENVKSAKTSLKLKFEDVMNAKEEECSVEIANHGGSNRKLQGDVEEKVRTNIVNDGGSIGSREMNLENVEGVKGEKDKEGEVEAVVAAKDEVSRELSLEDMLAMPKGEQDDGDAEKEHEGVKRENATEMPEVESREMPEVETLNAEGLKDSELNQEKLGASPGEADAGETATSLRAKGNAIFARGDFNNAASVYLRAAEKARSDGLKTEEILCLSNRAEVLIRLCRNQAAFEDAEAALKLLRECDGVNAGDLALAKALFRKGRALMGLHKYEDAMRVLQEVLAKAPADRQLREAAIKCRKHLQHVLKPGKRQRAAANRKKSASLGKQ